MFLKPELGQEIVFFYNFELDPSTSDNITQLLHLQIPYIFFFKKKKTSFVWFLFHTIEGSLMDI